MLSCLSKNLREEILKEVHMKIIKKIPFISNNFSKDFQQALSLKLND